MKNLFLPFLFALIFSTQTHAMGMQEDSDTLLKSALVLSKNASMQILESYTLTCQDQKGHQESRHFSANDLDYAVEIKNEYQSFLHFNQDLGKHASFQFHQFPYTFALKLYVATNPVKQADAWAGSPFEKNHYDIDLDITSELSVHIPNAILVSPIDGIDANGNKTISLVESSLPGDMVFPKHGIDSALTVRGANDYFSITKEKTALHAKFEDDLNPHTVFFRRILSDLRGNPILSCALESSIYKN